MEITILGAGYVGLVSAACLADLGHHVTCIDPNESRIAALLRGDIPIYEPGLAAIVARTASNGHLRFDTDPARALARAETAFICVGTPPRPEDGEADLGCVVTAARDIARYARDEIIVVMKSTVPVGTGDMIEGLIRRMRPQLEFGVVSNPEFLKEGAAIADFMEPDRIVIGAQTARAGNIVASIYAPLAQKGVRILRTRRRSAEAIKYAANAFLSVKLSFINEIADFCEAWDADIGDVATGIGLDRRIGTDFLQPGPGYGGSCFPKDLRALLHSARERAVGLRMVETASAVNEARKWAMGRRIRAAIRGDVSACRIAVMGLTFKAETDDMRESPALAIIKALRREGAQIRAHDPRGMEAARDLIEGVSFAEDPAACLRNADILVIATGWREYAALDPRAVAGLMRGRKVFDLRNILAPAAWRAAGFDLHRIGEAHPPVSIAFTADEPRRDHAPLGSVARQSFRHPASSVGEPLVHHAAMKPAE
ncbi:MAG: UDPglucose 6-dehydrogenase [Saliniramus fredricksonii]|uniref:UDP-glucose 6-dehydrogenase n=1 Tax=Saliniramus fredricksonii TaxID=1653334 RepID=A0A0P8A1W4_9HYPH|nr:UDP-glucose/GDP-mannose dehydrogenase family protein [Saliniramus fredricksonii]KPQ09143.1 MAG: UDPglucose 6-dehydrogenase [Saliniramus fredricksonii]SCC81601.1 UDPglucose 6-dehydrogenase [Saliniramus fredricksonii]